MKTIVLYMALFYSVQQVDLELLPSLEHRAIREVADSLYDVRAYEEAMHMYSKLTYTEHQSVAFSLRLASLYHRFEMYDKQDSLLLRTVTLSPCYWSVWAKRIHYSLLEQNAKRFETVFEQLYESLHNCESLPLFEVEGTSIRNVQLPQQRADYNDGTAAAQPVVWIRVGKRNYCVKRDVAQNQLSVFDAQNLELIAPSAYKWLVEHIRESMEEHR